MHPLGRVAVLGDRVDVQRGCDSKLVGWREAISTACPDRRCPRALCRSGERRSQQFGIALRHRLCYGPSPPANAAVTTGPCGSVPVSARKRFIIGGACKTSGLRRQRVHGSGGVLSLNPDSRGRECFRHGRHDRGAIQVGGKARPRQPSPRGTRGGAKSFSRRISCLFCRKCPPKGAKDAAVK